MLKDLTYGPQETPDDSRDSSHGITYFVPLDQEQDQHWNTINCFSELPTEEEDNETEAIFDLQHITIL